MAIYKYEAYDAGGKVLKGKGEFSNEKELKDFLKGKKLILKNFTILHKKRKRISKDEIISFTKELQIMLESGISIIKVLDIQREQYRNSLGEILGEIRESIINGSTIGEAFIPYGKYFGEFYISMVTLGDISGNLIENLKRISHHLELEEKIRRKVREALFYPCIVIGFTILVMIFLMTYVVPEFVTMFQESGVELPLLTKILIVISSNFHYILLGIICICTIIFFSLREIGKSLEGRRRCDSLKIKLPIYGNIIKKNINIRFIKNLSLMLDSGMLITDILDSMKNSFNNILIKEEIEKIRIMVIEGIKISDAMKNLTVFPESYRKMIIIGEESGELIKIFDRIVQLEQEELERYVRKLLVLIEPLLIATLGIVIGLVIIGIYLPIFSMSELIS